MTTNLLVALALAAAVLSTFSIALAQEQGPVQAPLAPAPSAPVRPEAAPPDNRPQAPLAAPSQSDRSRPCGLGEDQAWAPQEGYEYQIVPDDSWNRGTWEDGAVAPGAANRPSVDDRWWDWLPSDEAPLEGEEPLYAWGGGGDPGAIPGPEVGLEPPGQPDQFSAQTWGYAGDSQGAAAPQSRYPRQFSYGQDNWSDTWRYDDEKGFMEWWDSGLVGQPR